MVENNAKPCKSPFTMTIRTPDLNITRAMPPVDDKCSDTVIRSHGETNTQLELERAVGDILQELPLSSIQRL